MLFQLPRNLGARQQSLRVMEVIFLDESLVAL